MSWYSVRAGSVHRGIGYKIKESVVKKNARLNDKKKPTISHKTKFIIFMGLLCIIAVYYAFHWVVDKLNQKLVLPIRSVIIQSDFERIDQNRLRQVVAPLAHAGLFTVNLASIQASIQKIPWAAQVEVRRIWPNQLFIKITPEQVVARWGDTFLLNKYGEILNFGLVKGVEHLPLFTAPDSLASQVLNEYQQANEILNSIALTVVKINVDNSVNWNMTLSNGIILRLGDQEHLTRLRRFVKVYDKLIAGHADQVKSIDLRYNDGLAVAWTVNSKKQSG